VEIIDFELNMLPRPLLVDLLKNKRGKKIMNIVI